MKPKNQKNRPNSPNSQHVIMNELDINKALIRLSHEIVENNKDRLARTVLIGIRTRGVYVAERLNAFIEKFYGQKLNLGVLDITLYRDDLTRVGLSPVVKKTTIDFEIDETCVVLVDDVLFSGRTIRSAMDAVIDFGRPERIQLAVLIDRGHRELPIKADFVGKNIPTRIDESVEVRLKETDSKDEVVLHGQA